MSHIKSEIKDFYNNVAEHFSQTRKKFWPEFFYIAEEVEKLLQKQDKIKILELGCGDGRLYQFLKEKFGTEKIDYTGIDISEGLINIAKSNIKKNNIITDNKKNSQIIENNLNLLNNKENSYVAKNSYSDTPHFVVSDMLDFVENEKEETYDFVVSVASFQHIPAKWERLLILKHIYRILKFQGKLMMFNWSFSKWFFKKYKWQIVKAFLLSILSLGNRSINDIYIPWKEKGKTLYRYYHIFFLFELEKLFKLAGFVVKEKCFINKRGEKSVSFLNSRNSSIIGLKDIIK